LKVRLIRLPENEDKNIALDSGPPDAMVTHQYVINAMVSRFTVQAFASGFLSAFGHNPKFAIRDLTGEISFDPEQIEKSTMHLVIRANSLSVMDNISDKDRRDIESEMRDNVLEITKYPEIVFDVAGVSATKAAQGQFDVTLNGQLKLHGATRSQKVPATLAVNGDMLRAFGEFSLRQTDYGIKPVTAAGGGLKVKDEVKFTFDIVARQKN
jgi:polyisoprenoid-binding protein YceI